MTIHDMEKIVRSMIEMIRSLLTGDGYSDYSGISNFVAQRRNNCAVGCPEKNDYADKFEETLASTIKGFWAIKKRAIFGQVRRIIRIHLPHYSSAIDFQHNARATRSVFVLALHLGRDRVSITRCCVILSALVPLTFSTPALAGCGLGVSDILANVPAFANCLNPLVPKSLWENWSLASAGPVVFPGDAGALQVARNLNDGVAYGLLHGASNVASAYDTGSWSITRDATQYRGGNPSFVDSAFSATTNIGPNALSSEWALVGRVANYSVISQAVGVYGQGYNYSIGTAWGMVAEAYAKAPKGTAVGIEVDSGGIDKTTSSIGVDIVNTGNMKAAVRVQPGVPALVSSLDPGTYIMFNTAGGIDVYVRGVKVQSF